MQCERSVTITKSATYWERLNQALLRLSPVAYRAPIARPVQVHRTNMDGRRIHQSRLPRHYDF
jgi:hypothetical protein